LGVCKGELERKKKRKKEWRALGGEGLVFFIIQNPPNLGELKSIGGGFWGVWVNFPNPIIYCYNTLKIKSTLITSILLSFTRKTHSQFFLKISLFFLLISSLQSPPLPSPSNSQTKPNPLPLAS